MPFDPSELEDLHAAVRRAATLARRARLALALNVAIHGGGMLVGLAQIVAFRNGAEAVDAKTVDWLDQAFTTHTVAMWAGIVIGAVAFLAWTRAIFHLAPRLTRSTRLLKHPAREVVRSFFIPLVNLYRPFRAFSVLNEEIDPADLTEPTVRARIDEATGGYRDPAIEPPPPRIPAPSAPVGLWWTLWLARLPVSKILAAWANQGQNVTGALAAAVLDPSVDVVAALAAMVVVSRIDARMRERFRRIEHAPDEA